MSDILRIRSKYELWNDFIVTGINNKLSTELIRSQLMDAVRKEVFEQMCWRMKVASPSEAPHTPENEKIVESIARETRKKWHALMKMCNSHLQTLNLISDEHLQKIFPEEDEDDDALFTDAEDPEETWDGDERTAEWPELSEPENDSQLMMDQMTGQMIRTSIDQVKAVGNDIQNAE